MTTVETKCRYCNIVTRTLVFPDWATEEDVEKARNEVIDARCDTHLGLYGSYQEIEQKYVHAFGEKDEKFQELFDKAEGKKDLFDVEVEKEKARIKAEKEV